jgi:hypothetical protein
LLDFYGQQLRQSLVRHGEHIGLRRFAAVTVELNALYRLIPKMNRPHRHAQVHFPAALLNLLFAAVIQFRQGHRRNTHAISGAVGKECLPKHVHTKPRIGSIQLFI